MEKKTKTQNEISKLQEELKLLQKQEEERVTVSKLKKKVKDLKNKNNKVISTALNLLGDVKKGLKWNSNRYFK